jgi:hypothetical protein
MPRLGFPTAIAAVLLNASAFDTFLQVGAGAFRFSTFFSPRTVEYPLSDVRELAVYSQRIAPNGRVANQSLLEVRMRDGTATDTSDLIEEDDIPPVIAAMRAGLSGRIPYRHARQRGEAPSRGTLSA